MGKFYALVVVSLFALTAVQPADSAEPWDSLTALSAAVAEAATEMEPCAEDVAAKQAELEAAEEALAVAQLKYENAATAFLDALKALNDYVAEWITGPEDPPLEPVQLPS